MEPPHTTLKHDDTFVKFDSHGDMGASAGGLDGLFDCAQMKRPPTKPSK